MANVTKRTNKKGETSYLIRVFVDEKANGKQTVKSMTYKPEPEMTEKQIEKKLNETAILFEQKVKSGIIAYDGKIKFEAYAAKWLETAQLAPKTRQRYESLLVRVNEAIGHIRLQEVQAHHLEAFYKNLAEDGIKDKGRYATAQGLGELMEDISLTRDRLAKMADVAASTVGAARNGKRISLESAEKIATALDIPIKQLFFVEANGGKLSDKTILHHHRLISAILGTAKLRRIIPYNVALEHMKAPKVDKKVARYLDDNEARRLVELLMQEDDIRVKTAILLSLYSGIRRGDAYVKHKTKKCSKFLFPIYVQCRKQQ